MELFKEFQTIENCMTCILITHLIVKQLLPENFKDLKKFPVLSHSKIHKIHKE